MREKVFEIEFHINCYELDDFILRAAELIKEGYKLHTIKQDDLTISYYSSNSEPCIHITFRRTNQ